MTATSSLTLGLDLESRAHSASVRTPAHTGRKCKSAERLRLCRCWGASNRSSLHVTHRHRAPSTRHAVAKRSPWHSDASLPLRRFTSASKSPELGGWGVPGFGHWRPRGRRRRAGEERYRLRTSACRQLVTSLALGVQSPRSGTPGSDHVSRLGKACWMPNTSAGTKCVVVSRREIDLTLARWIGRNWTRPGRGNIALSRSGGQTYRAFAVEVLCADRRHGRLDTHTDGIATGQGGAGMTPTAAAQRVLVRPARGVRGAPMGAR